MSGFLDELGRKLAERWLTLLVLPGLVYLACLTVALTLRHEHALDVGRLAGAIDRLAARPAASTSAALLLTVTGVLAAAAAAGFAAGGLGRLTERVWTAEGRRWPARLLTKRRRKGWDAADADVQTQIKAAVRAQAGVPADGPVPDVAAAIAARDAIGLVPPRRPTWIGDRLRAADQRVHTAYDLDLTGAWPRLWLLVPDAARTELIVARDAYVAAARLVGWALLYLLVAWWWWPALPVALALAVTGWIRARDTVVVLADLIEAIVDLYGRDLATQLGVPASGPLSRETGLAISTTLRKDPETHHPAS